ncbi:polyhydroxyalkanoic acid system family protein [uncultured Sphingomonas sp.]|uniref:polyhydroxyalkanoic acid system family protein n=1 Tax=uncultured Sphingomonas sp. TaxID=158754 RepID=UPI0035C9FFC9
MTAPVEVDLPHKLGQAEARRRIERGFGKLAGWIPGGQVSRHAWEGDTLVFTVEAMGQRVAARLDVEETLVHARLELPAMLAMFAGQIQAALKANGPKLLE